MQTQVSQLRPEKEVKTVEDLPVVKNFRQVIETRDIGHMKKELYEFLHLHCSFIAHYDINGFKATYRRPQDFAGVFIRHFDRGHLYCSRIFACHEEPYKDTGFTKAEIKRAFYRLVERHKEAVGKWAEKQQSDARYALYLKLKYEFEGGE